MHKMVKLFCLTIKNVLLSTSEIVNTSALLSDRTGIMEDIRLILAYLLRKSIKDKIIFSVPFIVKHYRPKLSPHYLADNS